MGANDVLALNANFATWQTNRMPGLTGVDPFEFYCVDQFLKQFAVSDDELRAGLVGGGNDGGADAIYFFVNRRLVQEDTDLDPKTAVKVNLLIMQVKQNQGFSPVEIDKSVFLTDDLLDLSRKPADHNTTYNPKVLEVMRVFKNKYQEIAGTFPEVFIDYYYITKADATQGDDAEKASNRVKQKANQHLNAAKCAFHFVNAQKLWTQVQLRTPKSKPLHWQDTPLETPEGWVGLVKLYDYWSFLKDEHGDLHERIFESNVRGFQQNTPVNVSIRNTLDKRGAADFWLLNNGITILAGKASKAGYKKLEIDDPQIVNGLQTSRQIDAYYRSGVGVPLPEDDNRRIMVRVLQSSDEAVRDDVIRATNSQNKMPAEALRATDRIHGQIENLFRQYDLYYDRRKGQYKDEGKPIAKIVSVIELLQAMLAIVLKRPDDARARPRDYIREDDKYSQIFGDDQFDLTIFLKCVLLHRRVESFLTSDNLNLDIGHQRNLKFYLSMYVAAAQTKHAYAPPDKLLVIDVGKLEDELVSDCYERLWRKYQKLAEKFASNGEYDYDSLAKGPYLLKAVQTELRRRFTPRNERRVRGAKP
jgi:AIPR protein